MKSKKCLFNRLIVRVKASLAMAGGRFIDRARPDALFGGG